MVAMKRELGSGTTAKRRELKVVSSLMKQFPGAIRDPDSIVSVATVPTGSLYLDIALGVGGWPRSRISVLAGFESAGKTTLALKALAHLQRQGEVVAFIDVENALDFSWARKLGVDTSPDVFVYVDVDTLEEAGEITIQLAASGEIGGIVFDSVAAASFAALQKGNLGDSNMGKMGKLMGDFLKLLKKPVRDNNVMMLFINQLRDSFNPQDPRPVMPGGKALKFYASVIVNLRAKIVTPKDENTPPPNYATVVATVEKNKLAPPRRKAKYVIDFSGKISTIEEIVGIVGNKQYQQAIGVVSRGMMLDVPRAIIPDHIYEGDDAADTTELIHTFKGKPALLEAYSQDISFVEDVVAKYLVENIIKAQDFVEDLYVPGEYENDDAVSVDSLLDDDDDM